MLIKLSTNKEQDNNRHMSPADAALGIGGAAGAAYVTPKVVNKANDLASRPLSNLVRSGEFNNAVSEEVSDRIARKMGLSKNVTHYHTDIPIVSQYSPIDQYAYDRNGKVVGPSQQAIKSSIPYDEAFYKAQDAGNAAEAKRLTRKALNDLARTSEGSILGNKASYSYLHEVGHATGLMHTPQDAGAIRRGISKAYTIGQGVGGLLISPSDEVVKASPRLAKVLKYLPGGIAAARQANKEMTGDDNVVLQGADYASKGLTGLKLFEEAQASARPIYHLAREEGLKSALKASRHLGPAFLTYLAPAAAAHVFAPLAVKGAFAAKRAIAPDKGPEQEQQPQALPQRRFPTQQPQQQQK